jgi:hypothetical protein
MFSLNPVNFRSVPAQFPTISAKIYIAGPVTVQNEKMVLQQLRNEAGQLYGKQV